MRLSGSASLLGIIQYVENKLYDVSQAIMIFNWVQYQPVNYGKYTFPEYAEGIGWGIAGLSIICLPLGMIRGVVTTPGESLCEVGRL